VARIVTRVADLPPDDVVDPVDRKMHAILMHAAETLEDPEQRQLALDLAMVGPSVDDLNVDELWQLYELFTLAALRKDLDEK
jgi:hypothetical protein